MESDREVLELVELIYAAAGDPARWIEVLEWLSAVLCGNVGTIHHQDSASHESNFSSLWNLDAAAIAPYTAPYGFRNPLMTTRPEVIRAGAVNTLQTLCPKEIFVPSEYYNDYLRHLDLLYCIAGTPRNDGENSSNISVFRSPGDEPFGEEERKLLLVLMPHLQRAFQLHTRIQGLERKGDAAGDALDHLHQGILLLDAQGRVLLVNQAAAALFAGEKTIKLTPRGLVSAVPSESRQLSALIQRAITTGNGNGLHPGGAMMISRGGLGPPLQVLVAPLRTKTIHLGKDVPAVAIFISDLDRKTISDSAVFTQLYGLTRAEARLAHILAAGDSLHDAACKLGVAQSTVRSQLKSVFAKTNTTRQSQLVRILLMVPTQALSMRHLSGDVRR